MSFITRSVAHCDVPTCGHEWLTNGSPTHCAKCKSRKWNAGAPKDLLAQAIDQAPAEVDSVSLYTAAGTLLETRPVNLPSVAIAKSSKTHDPKTCNVYKCGMCAASK